MLQGHRCAPAARQDDLPVQRVRARVRDRVGESGAGVSLAHELARFARDAAISLFFFVVVFTLIGAK